MSTLTAHTGLTRNSEATAELWEPTADPQTPKLVAKMYANAEGTKIRIVLPELANYKQTLIVPDQHFIEFTRDVSGGLPNARR